MKISYLSLFPHFFDEFKSTSIIKRAIEKGKVELNVIDLKNEVKRKRVDSKIVSGGKGNLLRFDVVSDAINKYKNDKSVVILMTPRGKILNQKIAKELSKKEDIIFVCPHFEGIDQRIESEVDYCLSLGDYIISGGELASEVVSDAIIRLIEGVINKDSLNEESFNDNLLEYGQYALPRVYNGKEIPEIYFSGNHQAIEKYKLKDSLLVTKKNRPDLYKKHKLNDKEKKVLDLDDNYWKMIIDKTKNKK